MSAAQFFLMFPLQGLLMWVLIAFVAVAEHVYHGVDLTKLGLPDKIFLFPALLVLGKLRKDSHE